MSEIPSPTPEPERPKVTDRINAVLLTLRANPILAMESVIATSYAVGPPLEPAVAKKFPQLSDHIGTSNPELSFQYLLDSYLNNWEMLYLSFIATFGRPHLQTTARLIKAKDRRTVGNPITQIYKDTFISHISKAWRTGEIQIRETKPNRSDDLTFREGFKQKMIEPYRRFFRRKNK